MLKQVKTVRCTQVIAQVNLGFYDAQGNLVGEETFPQGETGPVAARLFHPHGEELAALMEMCVEQAWQKLRACGLAEPPRERDLPDGAESAGHAARRENNKSQTPAER